MLRIKYNRLSFGFGLEAFPKIIASLYRESIWLEVRRVSLQTEKSRWCVFQLGIFRSMVGSISRPDIRPGEPHLQGNTRAAVSGRL